MEGKVGDDEGGAVEGSLALLLSLLRSDNKPAPLLPELA